MKIRGGDRGFALPTVVITSLILMLVVVAGLSIAYSTRTSLDEMYYDQLSREASEAGLAFAQSCLAANNYAAQWTNANPLKAGTDCSGNMVCTSNCYVYSDGRIVMNFSVDAPTVTNGGQTLSSDGIVTLTRPSDGSVWKTYKNSTIGRYGAELTTTNVGFGYNPAGGFFGTIDINGRVKATGSNYFGQLGNGTTASTLVPTDMLLDPSKRALKLYSSTLSVGFQFFVINDQGEAYGAGANDYGQLGNGTTATPGSTPTRFNLPAGKMARSVSILGANTYVVTTDNNIYTTGQCMYGALGDAAPVAGCVNKSAPVRAALPTPDPSDLNTLPTDNIATDRQTTFVRMQGGRVYGWGDNHVGVLGTASGALANSSTPVKIGVFGDSGQPQAVHISYDGETLYVTDSNGELWASGLNAFGEAAPGGAGRPIYYPRNNKCFDNNDYNMINIQLHDCNGQPAQNFIFWGDGSIRLAGTSKCIDNPGGTGQDLQFYDCNGSAAQRFEVQSDTNGATRIYYPKGNMCIDNYNADGQRLWLYPCNNLPAQRFSFPNVDGYIERVAIPNVAADHVVKTSTDFTFVAALTASGNVWMFGDNVCGNLGDGTVGNHYNIMPRLFKLPAGVSAIDVFVTAEGGNISSYNTFVIGSDRRVYGAGGNAYGQLGRGGAATQCEGAPQPMVTIDGTSIQAKQVIAGSGTAIIYTTNGRVYTVGRNNNGQLGDGTTTDSSTPKANIYTNVIQPIYY